MADGSSKPLATRDVQPDRHLDVDIPLFTAYGLASQREVHAPGIVCHVRYDDAANDSSMIEARAIKLNSAADRATLSYRVPPTPHDGWDVSAVPAEKKYTIRSRVQVTMASVYAEVCTPAETEPQIKSW
ncbi:hypothetical protein HYQ46_010993 [Verticillium longisporum]|nr:hypothetical protein HYQ46_010993 [Verticillium longisporum]